MKETIFYATFKAKCDKQEAESFVINYSNEEKTLFEFFKWIEGHQEQIRKSINQPNAEIIVTSINFIKNNY